MKEVFIN